MNINYLLQRVMLILAFGSVMFLFSCNEDEDPVQAPVAGFSFSVNNDTGVVTFTNTSTGEGNTYSWNFGDSQTSDQESPSNTYAASGDYIVVLTATNEGGSDTETQTVTVTLPDTGPECTDETAQSTSAADLNITFLSDPEDDITITSDNAGYERVANPDFMNSVNPSCFVGQITRDGAASVFANNQFTLAEKLDFNVNGSLKIKVWSPTASSSVTLKLEDAADAAVNTEVTVPVAAANTWEELTFNFTNADNKFDKIVLFFDLNSDASTTYYFDDLMLVAGDGTGGCTVETEESLSAADLNLTFLTDPLETLSIVSDNAGYARIANPDSDNEVNSSCSVAEITRDGASLFANNQFTLDAKLDFNGTGGFTLKAWSAGTGTTVTVKLEDAADAGINTEQTVTMTKSSEWEELTFSFDNQDNKYDKIVLFFDLNTNNSATYYFDDLKLVEGDGAACTVETSESLLAADFNLTFLTDPETALSIFSDNAGYARIANPDFDNAVNSSCSVAEITRDGASLFANNQFTLDAKLNFNVNGGFKLKAWSAGMGTTVTVKLEDAADAGINTEQTITMTKSSEWEELTFTFENQDDKYDKIVLFFDLNTNNTATYYFDDLQLVSGDGGGGSGGTNGCTGDLVAATVLPVDFEGCETFLSQFGTGISSGIDVNPSKDATNGSDFVLKVDRAVGSNRFAGVQNSFPTGANPLDFSGDNVLKLKIYSSKAGAVFRFELALDPQTDPVTGNPAPVFVTVDDANTWTEVEVDFNAAAFPSGSPDTYNLLVIKPDNPDGTDGETTTMAETFYFDDISIGASSGSGGSSPSSYCNAEIKHFGGNAGSEARLTIESVTRGDGFPALKFTVATDPTNGKAPDALTINSFEGGNGLEAADTSVPGEISIQAFWPSGAPANNETTFNVLWSFDGEPETWQLFETITDIRISLDASCE